MKIMYINDVGFDNQNGNNHLTLSMFIKFLSLGYDLYYVAAHSDGKSEDIPNELLKYDNLKYDIISKKSVSRTSFVKRFINSIIFEYKARRKYKKEIRNMDIIILQSHYTAFLTARMLKKYKKKVVYNVYDIFPGVSYESSGLPSKTIYSIFLQLQKVVYKNCSKIFTLTSDTKNTLIKLGVLGEKIEIIPNWFDQSKIKEIEFESNSFAQEFNMKKNKKYIQYAGTLGVSYNFDYIITLAQNMIDREDIVFQIVGDGYKLKDFKNKAEHLGLDNITFIPWQPTERLSEVYSACTLQIVPLLPGVICNSYPSKILPLMGCHRSALIFVDENSRFFESVNKKGIAKCIKYGDYKSAKEFILEICDNEAFRREYEMKAYDFVCEEYTMEKNTDKMLEVFDRIMEENKNVNF